ncbi:MAG: DUF4386 domain-containing protein [Pseudomonadota bacterium]
MSEPAHYNTTTDGLSARAAALTAGLGLLVMTLCAPVAWFYFIPQVVVQGDGAATLERFQSAPRPYLIGGALLFVTYLMDIVVAWALYWLLLPDQRAMSLLAAWMRLIYTGMAFVGLMSTWRVYDYAVRDAVEASDIAIAQIVHDLAAADSANQMALFFFGFHLLVLGVAVWRSVRVPRFIGLAVIIAGASYIIDYALRYIAPNLAPGWLILLALGELVFMLWLLIAGWSLNGKAPVQNEIRG